MTVQVIGLVGLVTIGMTVDAEALPHEHEELPTASPREVSSEDIQAYITPAEVAAETDLGRENYSVEMRAKPAETAGITNASEAVFGDDTGCAVRWPYAAGVPISSGFGMRNGRMHEGTDFASGAGAQIQSIADGVVRVATDNGGAYGVTIVIDHVVDGKTVSSRYAHMEYDSRQVEVGDIATAGQYIGRTGNTGRSYGAHLHFEVRQSGTTAMDPVPWLTTNANC